jgi:hypothetical protein
MSLIGNLKKVQSQVPDRPRTRKVAKKKEYKEFKEYEEFKEQREWPGARMQLDRTTFSYAIRA